MSEPIVLALEGVIPPEREWLYTYVPFDVPEGIRRIDVAYSYDAAIHSDPHISGGNTLDIGIFDARGVDFHSQGFRGWTGSARASFFIALDEATPGYMPGPILPGTWTVVLGPYKVAPDGCHYRIDVKMWRSSSQTRAANGSGTALGRSAEIGFPKLLPLRDAPSTRVNPDGWYKGDLHCHTVNSDGDSTPETLVRLGESLGFDFLAVTDHNNRTQMIDLAKIETPLMLIPGYEVTTYYGHWNIWGDGNWIDFRVQSADDLAGFIAEAKQHGYLVSCNHPRLYGPDWAFADVEGFRCVEVWNGPWQLLNSTCLEFWEKKLRRGERLTAVGGSDHHFTRKDHIARLGHPTTYIYCEGEPSPAKLLDALRAGHAFVSEAPDSVRVTLNAGDAMMGDVIPRPAGGELELVVTVQGGAGTRLRVIRADGVVVSRDVTENDARFEIMVDVSYTPYVRTQIIDPATGDTRALTNPIYLE